MIAGSKPIVSESKIQRDFFSWVRGMQLVDWRYRLITAIPNGGKRSARHGARMKAEGLTAGFPDVIGLIASGPYHGFAIEFKSIRGKVRESQADIMTRLTKAGYLCVVCRNAVCAQDFVERYLAGKLP